jgi:hypothetical protein
MEENKIKEILEVYRTCWSETSEISRENKLKEIILENFEYYDPNTYIVGHSQLSEYMAQFQKEYLGCTFNITQLIIHHDRSLANWQMMSSENVVIGQGSDFAFYKNGKLNTISSFFTES